MIFFIKQLHSYINHCSVFIGYYCLLKKFQATNQGLEETMCQTFFEEKKECSCVLFHSC